MDIESFPTGILTPNHLQQTDNDSTALYKSAFHQACFADRIQFQDNDKASNPLLFTKLKFNIVSARAR